MIFPRITLHVRRWMPLFAATVFSVPSAGRLTAQEESPAPRAKVVPESPEETAVEEASTPKIVPKAKPRPAAVKTAEEELFDYCQLLFNQKNYASALRQYDQYLQIHPEGKFRQEARFKLGICHVRTGSFDLALMEFDSWLRDYPSGSQKIIVLFYAGECHLELGNRLFGEEKTARQKFAENAYAAALRVSKTGPYAANCAYRLAVLAYNDALQSGSQARYKTAINYFTITAAQASDKQVAVRHSALYFKGLSCRAIGSVKEASAALEELVKKKEDNAFYEKALLELAALDLQAGRRDAAMKRYEVLALEGKQALIRVQSLVNTGLILAENDKTDEAVAKFEQALAEKQTEKFSSREELAAEQARARFGLIFAYNKRNEPNRVVEAWRGMTDYTRMDDATRAKMLFIVAGAYSTLEQYLRAADIYRILEESLPGREEAFEGGYKRLVCLFKTNDPQVPEAAEAYVNSWRGSRPESALLDKAWRVRAAYYFNRRLWKEAANSYQRLREKKLEPEMIPDYLYERGYAEAEHGDKEGISTLTDFLQKAPEDPRVQTVVLQRGLLRMKAGDLTGALADFDTVRKKYPGSAGEESAIFNAARVKGRNNDFAGMVTDFQELLEKYPQTKAAAEAWFWIGRGYFQLKKFEESLAPLRKARELDGPAYYTDGTQHIIESLAQLKDLDALIPEVDGFLKGTQPQKIRPKLLSWLGFTLFHDRKDYRAAARYLKPVTTPDNPAATEPEIWVTLGECYVETGQYEEALQALQYHLAAEQRNSPRARAFWLQGRACLGLKKYPEATTAAETGLTLERETVLTANLLMLAGDAALQDGRLNEAFGRYLTVKVGWELPKLTPLAIWKMAGILEVRATGEDKQKAEELRAELTKYPDFQPPAA